MFENDEELKKSDTVHLNGLAVVDLDIRIQKVVKTQDEYLNLYGNYVENQLNLQSFI